LNFQRILLPLFRNASRTSLEPYYHRSACRCWRPGVRCTDRTRNACRDECASLP
jgi:hypothetical protein